MSTSVRLIRRYVWLIDTIRSAGRITLDEINRKWLNNQTLRLDYEKAIPERTFHRHRAGIAELFGINILCDHHCGNKYYIENADALTEPSFTSWLFNGLAIDNQLLGNETIAHRVVFEDTPGGMEYMPIVIHALSERRKIRLTYASISHGFQSDIIVEPYFIKERLRRWYIIGKAEDAEKVEIFAFDRIESLTLLDGHFDFPSDINPKTYFDEVIGILLDDEYDCERVVLRLYNKQAENHSCSYFVVAAKLSIVAATMRQSLIFFKKSYARKTQKEAAPGLAARSPYNISVGKSYSTTKSIRLLGASSPDTGLLTPRPTPFTRSAAMPWLTR